MLTRLARTHDLVPKSSLRSSDWLMRSELGYFARSLISRLNDCAATLKFWLNRHNLWKIPAVQYESCTVSRSWSNNWLTKSNKQQNFSSKGAFWYYILWTKNFTVVCGRGIITGIHITRSYTLLWSEVRKKVIEYTTLSSDKYNLWFELGNCLPILSSCLGHTWCS